MLFSHKPTTAGDGRARGRRPAFEPLESRRMLDAGPLLISELLAFNDDTLTDADGDHSDWIEIYNPTDAAVELDGWYLTDDAADLKKWQFPDVTDQAEVTLDAGAYLVVFASGKDQVNPLQELHTNFSLSGAGEFLALVQPDAETISHAYAPEYPPQAEDWSYGITAELGAFFVPAGSALSYRVPSGDDDALGTTWTSPGFDDSGWTRYGEASDVLVTEVATGSNDYLEIQNVAKYPINTTGWFVAINQPGDGGILDVHPVVWDLSGWMEVDEVLYRSDDDGDADTYWGDDIVWKTRGDGWVMILDDQGRIVDLVIWGYSPEEIAALDVTVGGFRVTAEGAWSGNSVPPVGSRSNSLQRLGDADHHNATDWSFTTPQSLGEENQALTTPFSRDVSVAVGFSSVPSSIADTVQIDVETEMHQVNSSLYARYPFYVDDPATLSELQLQVQYNDGFVAYLNGQEVARRNAPEAPAWNAAAPAARSAAESVVFEEIDLADFRDDLLGGTNVLAIHGLNFAAEDPDFLILPKVSGTGIRYFAEPTPGEKNGIGTPRMGPLLRDVTENPPPPGDDESLVITAAVGQTFYTIDQVTLHYRVDFGDESTLTMADDGNGADAEAGDGIYTATVDSNAYGPGDMVRWRVTAEDSAGRSSSEPAFLDQDGRNQSPEYYGTVVVDPSVTSDLPVFHWFAEKPNSGHTRGGTRTSVFFDGRFYDNAFVRQRGGATNNYSQKFDFNRGAHFFVNEEIGTVQEFNLNAQGSDSAYLRQPLAFQTFPAAGNAGSESFLMLTQVNGRFDRVGVFIEQVDDEFLDRVGLDPEGALYKFVQRGNLNPVFADTTTGIEKKTRLGEDFSDLQTVVDGLNLPTEEERRRFVFDNFDLPQLINYLAVRPLILDADDVRKNFYLYRDTNGSGEWSIFPWDKDWTFGVTGDGGTQLTHPFFGDYAHRKQNANQWNVLYDVIFNDPVTQEMFLRRLRSVMDELLQPPGTPVGQRYFEQSVDEMAAAITPHVNISANSVKNYFPTRRTQLYVNHSIDNWTPGGNIAGIPHAQVGNPPIEFATIEYNPASGDQDEEYIELINNNPTAVDVSYWQLDGGVRFSFRPGTVIPAGSSLYVTPEVSAFRSRADGPSGGQGLFVQGAYRGHLSSFGETIRLVAADGEEIDSLTYPGDPSGPQQFLRVSEIMYNPPEPTPEEIHAGWIDNDDFEFIELVNTGSETLNLEGIHFAAGVEFAFGSFTLAAGEYVLVAGNEAAFEARYGAGKNVAGAFTSGRFDNGGEVVKLNDRLGSTILQFRYNDGGQWPGEADGAGPSLRVVDTDGDFGAPQNWRYSTRYGGSPGAPPDAALGVVVNEVLSHTDAPLIDAIELVNTADHAIDLGGWYLSDSRADLTKYRISDGTVIPAGGYLVVDERDFNATPADPAPTDFALNGAHGDDVWLSKADTGGSVTHVADHAEFPAAAEGESWGRWPDAQGDLYPMIAPTLDPAAGQNAGPRIGPVLISEVHYHPQNVDEAQDLEFVEIYNPTARVVELDNWRIRKGIDFDFADGTVLAPGGTLLVLPFDPEDPAEAGRLSDFVAHYQLDASVPMVGGYSGNLDNAGDRVQLQRPDEPIAIEENFIPHLLEDEVTYGDAEPWPADADGGGDSLQRLGLGRWGNDPSSWTAASPTPGSVEMAAAATIAGRHVFYNNSAFDVTGDDQAVAPDKEALLPGERATFANYTSYSAGINGLMVDVHSLGGTPAAADFEFHVGNDDDPGGWSPAPSPQSIAVRAGAGSGGSDRVTIIWADNAIRRQWLQVTVRATATTGLAEDDVFYFGNAIGEAGNSTLNAIVNTTDEVAARNFQHGPTNLAAIDDPYDYDRDRLVNATDRAIARNNQTGPITALRLITAPARDATFAQVAAEGLDHLGRERGRESLFD